MKSEQMVIQCIKKLTSVSKKIQSDTSLIFDLQMDSMMLISLGMVLEEKTGVSIVDFSENIDFVADVKVGQIVDLIENKRRK